MRSNYHPLSQERILTTSLAYKGSYDDLQHPSHSSVSSSTYNAHRINSISKALRTNKRESSRVKNKLQRHNYTASGEVFIYDEARITQGYIKDAPSPLYGAREFLSLSGLSFYKYRHYSAELGRWPSRDPIGERGGVNLYGFLGNNSVSKLDYLGLIMLEFNAFIPASVGRELPDARFENEFSLAGEEVSGTWFDDPKPLSPWFISTDNRDFGGGKSRMKSISVDIGIDDIGSLEDMGDLITTTSDVTTRLRKIPRMGNLKEDIYIVRVESKTEKPTHDVTVKDINADKSTITIDASGTYPFDDNAPSIDYDVKWTLCRVDDVMTVNIEGTHNEFPNYEALIHNDDDVDQFYSAPTVHDGPGLGLVWWDSFKEGPKEY